jgi:glycosyltransferase involved in cell wall biosynthesis
MIRVLHLLDDSDPTALSLVAPALPRGEFDQSIGLLGGKNVAPLPDTGIAIRSIPVRPGFDVAGWRVLRRVVGEFRPNVLHSWGPRAARFGWLLSRRTRGHSLPPRLIASATDHPEPDWRGILTRRAVRAADRAIAFGEAEAARYRALGVPAGRLTVAPLGVVPARPPAGDIRSTLGIPTGVPFLVAAGGPGAKDAVWAFDVVRYADPVIRLVVVGDWPDRSRVERFARAITAGDWRVAFVGDRPDLSAILAAAAAVWIPMPRRGARIALAALAAGAPVVGYHSPDLDGVISDGEFGILVAPGDRVALAGRTIDLLDDPVSRDRIVTAARAAAATRFPPGPVAAAVAAAYHAVSTQTS